MSSSIGSLKGDLDLESKKAFSALADFCPPLRKRKGSPWREFFISVLTCAVFIALTVFSIFSSLSGRPLSNQGRPFF